MSGFPRVTIAPNQVRDQQIFLSSEQYHYLSRVLRLNSGDRFIAINGLGKSWLTRLWENQGQILAELTDSTELPLPVILLVALPKGNGFDEIIRQTTELGVTELVPMISDRTLLHPSLPKLQRWRRIAQEATEQSERQIVPRILDPLEW